MKLVNYATNGLSFRVWVSHPIESTKPTILRNCGLIFLSVTRLIAKIFGAVSRTISLMRLSALLASKRCRCRDDGFCSCYLARFLWIIIEIATTPATTIVKPKISMLRSRGRRMKGFT